MQVTALLRFARLHRLWPILAGVVLVALLSAFLGGFEIPLPSLDGGAATGIPFRRDLPLLSGVFLAAAGTSSMHAYERAAGPRYFRLLGAYVLALTVVASLCSFAVQGLAAGAHTGVSFVRSMLIWFGLARVSARVIGWNLAWVLPVASVFPLIWLSDGAWWDWTAAPAADPVGWGTAAVSLSLGVLLTAATPWRVRSLLHSVRRHP
ncbi:hypothetical protein [Streptomyces sp. NPDC053069]|uniref:hypothetical protein n=1 Tax=Streptomyces sp. NPDC053069 TaxID=3365695 RepID=UPI0037D42B0C